MGVYIKGVTVEQLNKWLDTYIDQTWRMTEVAEPHGRLIDADDYMMSLANVAKVKAKFDAQKSLMGRCMYILEHKPTIIESEK